MFHRRFLVLASGIFFSVYAILNAETVTLFNDSQLATLVSVDVNSDTISSYGYLFTYSRDKLFTGGVGMTEPIGRYVRIPWPQGIEAQGITTGPAVGTGARITIRRIDGAVFDLTAFTARLLANTVGTGGAIEIMPIMDGEDGLNDPLAFDASGSAGMEFSYDTSPNHLGSTALLKGYEEYKLKLFVDFALTALTLDGPTQADINRDGVVNLPDLAILSEQWLSIPMIPSADIDSNGGNHFIDLSDFTQVTSRWLMGQ